MAFRERLGCVSTSRYEISGMVVVSLENLLARIAKPLGFGRRGEGATTYQGDYLWLGAAGTAGVAGVVAGLASSLCSAFLSWPLDLPCFSAGLP